MSKELYWLSVLDNIQETGKGVSIVIGLCTIIALIVIGMLCDSCSEVDKKISRRLRLSLYFQVPLLILMVSICALVPTREDLIESHVILEGKEILTKENLTEITDEIMKRVDYSIDFKEER